MFAFLSMHHLLFSHSYWSEAFSASTQSLIINLAVIWLSCEISRNLADQDFCFFLLCSIRIHQWYLDLSDLQSIDSPNNSMRSNAQLCVEAQLWNLKPKHFASKTEVIVPKIGSPKPNSHCVKLVLQEEKNLCLDRFWRKYCRIGIPTKYP